MKHGYMKRFIAIAMVWLMLVPTFAFSEEVEPAGEIIGEAIQVQPSDSVAQTDENIVEAPVAEVGAIELGEIIDNDIPETPEVSEYTDDSENNVRDDESDPDSLGDDSESYLDEELSDTYEAENAVATTTYTPKTYRATIGGSVKVTLNIGDKLKIYLKSGTASSWSSANSSIARVTRYNQYGYVTTYEAGTVRLTVKLTNGKQYRVTLNVKSLLDAPTDVSATMLAPSNGMERVKITWSTVSNNAGYRLYYSTRTTWKSTTSYTKVGKNKRSLTLKGKSISNLTFWVAAVDASGNVGYVSSYTRIPASTVSPVYVSGHSSKSIVEYNPSHSLTIRWNRATNGNGYYQYVVKGMDEMPDFEDTNQKGTVITEKSSTSATSFTVSASELKKYTYLKIAIAARDKNYSKNRALAWLVFGIKVEAQSKPAGNPVIRNETTGQTFTAGTITDYSKSSGDLKLTLSATNSCGQYKIVMIALNEAPDFSDSYQANRRDRTKFTDGYAYNSVIDASTYKSWVNRFGGIQIAVGDLSDGQYLKIAVGAYANAYDSEPASWTSIGIKMVSHIPLSSFLLTAADVTRMVEKNHSGPWYGTGRFRGVRQTPYDAELIYGQTCNYENWKQFLNNGAGGMCNRASASMALSYMGVDVKPYEFASTNSNEGSNSVEGVNNFLSSRGVSASKAPLTWAGFNSLYNQYTADKGKGKVSPIMLYTHYAGGSQHIHWIVVIGQDSYEPEYFWVLDPALGHYAQIRFTEVSGSLRIDDYRYKKYPSNDWKDNSDYSSRYSLITLMQYKKEDTNK